MSLPSEQFCSWTRENVLGFWADHAWDSKRGGWFEYLDAEGTPDERACRRVRVSARQVYVYAHAQYLGWHAPSIDSLEMAFKSFDVWWNSSWAVDGMPGFVNRLDQSLGIADHRRDSYDHAFAVLALSWLYRVSGDSQVLSRLNQVMDFVVEHMGHPNGGLVEQLTLVQKAGNSRFAPQLETRRQNPHMHWLEAMMAAHQATQAHGTPDSRFREQASIQLTLFEEHFFDAQQGWILEHFDGNWRPVKDDPLRRTEPGHGMEWVWLLNEAARIFPDLNLDERAVFQTAPTQFLFETARNTGLDAKWGLIVDFYDPVSKQKAMSARSWPTLEFIRASIAKRDENVIERAAESFLAHFALPENPGGWRDAVEVGALAQPHQANSKNDTASYGKMQTSTAYHVIGAAAALSEWHKRWRTDRIKCC